jgi:plastocyanin
VKHIRLAAVRGAVAITAAGLGAGAAITGCGSTAKAPAATASARTAVPAGGAAYSYYLSMMRRLYPGSSGTMMGGGTSYGWMMSGTGYRWMMGSLDDAPAWMTGTALPGFMMGAARDPGEVMGALFAGAPGPRVTPAGATRLGSQVPAGATVIQARNEITFSGTSVRLTVLASPAGGPDETFRIAGMANPDIVLSPGSHVSIQVINADPDTAHGLVITASASSSSSWMPMMTARPAFPGSALWFLGNPTAAGMHASTLTFIASTPGTYHYLCPVPGHAQQGMAGTFTVTGNT